MTIASGDRTRNAAEEAAFDDKRSLALLVEYIFNYGRLGVSDRPASVMRKEEEQYLVDCMMRHGGELCRLGRGFRVRMRAYKEGDAERFVRIAMALLCAEERKPQRPEGT